MKLPLYFGKLKKPKFHNPGWPLMVRRVQGHSMVPVLPPRTLIIGLRWHRHPLPGEVVIIRYDNRELVKRVESIKNGRLFVLGDHADTSTDSRHFGTIRESEVIARVIIPGTHKPKV